MTLGYATRRWIICTAAAAMLAGNVACETLKAQGTAAVKVAAPADIRSDASYYLTMRDGTRIAIGLWYPGGKPPTGQAPVLLVQTRYGRAGIYGYNEGGRYADFRKAGYVVAIVDVRGSTASFGPRDVEMGPDEIADMDEIIRHFRAQPWSNGQVIATGLSYMASTADLATGSPARLTAAIVREADFDPYRDLMLPGGISNDFMLEGWGADTLRRDLGRSVDPALGLDCTIRVADCPGLFPRMQPVDADPDFALIRQAIAGRRRWTSQTYAGADYFDDKAANGYALAEFSPGTRLAEIRKQAVPVQYWGSWMDAGTASGALNRYRAAPEVPAQVIITANSHGGNVSTDPFFTAGRAPVPSFDDQIAAMQGFAAKVRAGEPIARSIRYYVLGAGIFRDTPIWPPKGIEMRRLHLDAGHSLTDRASGKGGANRYPVDFAATTGATTRWSTQFGAAADYGDRRAADAKLIAYTGKPFDRDMELAGRASVTLTMTAETTDPAIFVYLEDVAPDGRVTYLTEGMLRAVSRKLAGPGDLPYPMDAPAHSHKRADAEPVTPGKPFEVRIAFFPVAALVRRGHAIRVAIAGADAGTFRRYSEGKPDVFTIFHGGADGSALYLPLKPWDGP
jgi:putative CocE/NonD family hydrolase